MLAGLTLEQVALLAGCGVLLDWCLGELPRWHPLVGFGHVAGLIERWLNRGTGAASRVRGIGAWLIAVLPLTALGAFAALRIGAPAHALLLYFCIGLRSLREHNLPIADALAQDNLPLARRLTARIVSRDTEHASAADLAKASIESLLENGNDAVFGTLFWFIVAGGAGALLFRLANTLDAMWGYRTPRFLRFGWAAARIDDVLNFIPARLTALSYLVLGAEHRRAWLCWRTQAPAWSSPNAGPVMACGAGALGLALGGPASYDGKIELRPPLGLGRAAQASDIARAWRLIAATTWLWLAVIGAAALARSLSNA